MLAFVLLATTLLLFHLGGLPLGHPLAITGLLRYTWEGVSILWWLTLAAVVPLIMDLRAMQSAPSRYDGSLSRHLALDVITLLAFAAAACAIIAFVFDMGLTALFTSGILAVTLGLALQSTLSDLLAGVALSLEAPFHVGDWVTIGSGSPGRVIETNWRSMRIHLPRFGTLVIPNQLAAKQQITNHSYPISPRKLSVRIVVGDTEPPHQVMALLRSAALGAQGVLETPVPHVRVRDFLEHAVAYTITFYTNEFTERKEIVARVLLQAWEHLTLAGIQRPRHRLAIVETSLEPIDRLRAPALERLLSNIELFRPLSSIELFTLSTDMVGRHFGPNETVVEQGADGRSLFVVRDGALRVLLNSADGSEREIARLGAGQCFGEMSLLTGAPRAATIRTITDCVLYEISDAAIGPLIKARPELAASLGRILAQRADTIEAIRSQVSAPAASGVLAHITQMINACFGRD